jgi:hypothetical protein
MNHPIIPPPELIEDWIEQAKPELWKRPPDPNVLCTIAAQWGADQELEACSALMDDWGLDGEDLMLCRRPKPPSLKEQALALINHDPANQPFLSDKGIDIIRRALEQLDG